VNTSTRCAILLITDPGRLAPPPGISAASWRAALAEDVADLLAGLVEVTCAVAAAPPDQHLATSLVWPGTRVFALDRATPVAAFRAAASAGFTEAAVVSADVPDMPALHIGKLFRALGSHSVAAAPAAGRGLVALAARLPVPGWLVNANPDLDHADVETLRAAAPTARSVAGTPGWHRLRGPADIAFLDPGLEGWDATRALLSGPR
jgi:hypothetical protein